MEIWQPQKRSRQLKVPSQMAAEREVAEWQASSIDRIVVDPCGRSWQLDRHAEYVPDKTQKKMVVLVKIRLHGDFLSDQLNRWPPFAEGGAQYERLLQLLGSGQRVKLTLAEQTFTTPSLAKAQSQLLERLEKMQEIVKGPEISELIYKKVAALVDSFGVFGQRRL